MLALPAQAARLQARPPYERSGRQPAPPHRPLCDKGADPGRMMLELFGRQGGYCRGKGGSMHIADFSVGMLGANGVVAGGIPIVTGAGLAAQLEGKGRVA